MSELVCSQCGTPAPLGAELLRWKHGELIQSGELDEPAAAMLICPECDAEDRTGVYDEGAGD